MSRSFGFCGRAPAIEHVEGRWHRLKGDLQFRVLGRHFRIKSGFVFNGASVPWPLSLFWNPVDNRWVRAAAVHDFLYDVKGQVPGRNQVEKDSPLANFSRRDSDVVFAALCGAGGTPLLTRWLFYAGVRLVGWRFWGQWTERARRALEQ